METRPGSPEEMRETRPRVSLFFFRPSFMFRSTKRTSLFAVAFACFASLVACSKPEPRAPEAKKVESAASVRASNVGELAPGEPMTGLPIEADDARTGSDDALVTVVSFLDFECRYCKQNFETLLSLRERYEPSDLRIVIKHLPLGAHPMAGGAAIAGQAVTVRRGSEAFLVFARLAFAGQAEMDYVMLAAWAERAGLPREVYDEAVSSETTTRRVEQDMRVAIRLGVEATPTSFVNGHRVAGAEPIENFTKLVDAELATAKQRLGAGASDRSARARVYAETVEQNLAEGLATALLESDPGNYRVPVGSSPTRGPSDAKVTVVVFSDYQCPYCQRGKATLDELVRRHPADVRVVSKHLPLPFHEQALPAARLAEATFQARGGDAFAQIEKELYAVGPELSADYLTQLGAKVGFEPAELSRILSGEVPAVEARIRADQSLADDVEARGTPHFFVNGRRLSGARPIEHFEAYFGFGLGLASEELTRGTTPSGLYDALQKDAVSPGAPEAVELTIPSDHSPARGPKGAPITIHVFSDFECPYCRRVEESLAELDRKYPGKLRFVWHDVPLPFHERARPLARAAREARRQGGDAAFWKLHDAIFALDQETPRLAASEIAGAAKSLGLDEARIRTAMTDESRDADIVRDEKLAEELGFKGTPTIVVGKFVVRGARPLSYFERVVELGLAPR